MTMITCNECSAEISSTAKACPKCGWTRPRRKVWPWIVGVPAVLIVGIFALGASVPQYKHTANKMRDACYELAARPDRHLCDEAYDRAITEGKAAELAFKSSGQ